MDSYYDFKKVEQASQDLWGKKGVFDFDSSSQAQPFSMFMMPPNTSGPMHIGNSLMLALQDILARYHRAKGRNVLWVPGLDHGGYETQVTYERELEKQGVVKTREEFNSKQLYVEIEQFVASHKQVITDQIKSLGASMDLSQMLYTMDESCIEFTNQMFKQMVNDGIIVRNNYMMNYCPSCATVLADIEIKKKQIFGTSYLVKFLYPDSQEYLTVETNQPEMLYSMNYILVHPDDRRYRGHIGEQVINPVTGEVVFVLASKRSIKWHQERPQLVAFYPNFERYDYEYAVRNNLTVENQLDWEGKLQQGYAGSTLQEARLITVEYLQNSKLIVSQNSIEVEDRTCKKGHSTVSLIKLAWFLKVDDKAVPLRKNAIEAFLKEDPAVYTNWRKKGILDWLKKMPDWPISRQNVWGITLPVHYEISDPSQYLVWFFDQNEKRQHGNLQDFLNQGYSLEEIQNGLQRLYASESCRWVLEQEEGKQYLSETDTLDTWFSSTIWGIYIYKKIVPNNFDSYYPSENVVLGHDLLRLFIARKVLLGVYLTNRLPFKRVFFHPLVLGEDGQKMSKSLGNSVTLNEYIEKYGADCTRFALVSCLDTPNDFAFGVAQLESASGFVDSLWRIARAYHVITEHGINEQDVKRFDSLDFQIVKRFTLMSRSVAKNVEKYYFQRAQKEVADFLSDLESLLESVVETGSDSSSVAFLHLFKKYLIVLHPFVPHVTEAIYQSTVAKNAIPLAQISWPE